MNRYRRPALILLCLLNTSPGRCEDGPASLSDSERKGYVAITPQRVLSTVSFLSSDAMAGRDTPSRELDIATAYVAARFRGAGLEPLGDEDTFFHYDTFETVQPPASAFVKIDGRDFPLNVHGVLAGADSPLKIAAVVTGEDELQSVDAADMVVLDKTPFRASSGAGPDRVLAALTRHLRLAIRKKAQVVFVPCSRQDALVATAQALQERPLPNRRVLIPKCGVVLVPDDAALAGQQVQVSLGPMQKSAARVRNVVGLLKGSDPDAAKKAIVVSAHVDHVGRGVTGSDLVFNGADDNATGVTAVTMLATALGQMPQRPARSIVFAAFWGEEKGLLGSKSYVARPAWPLKDTIANVNIEMIGRPERDAENRMWMTGWRHSDLGTLMNTGARRAGVEVFDRTDVGEMLYRRSDNASFVDAGVIAHSFSAGSLHQDYHQPTDEWEKLNINHMTNIIRGLYCGVLHLAGPDVKPSGEQN